MKEKCPICKKKRAGIEQNEYFPFCSSICKHVDLWNWLNGEYGISEEVVEESDDGREEPEKFWRN